MSPVRLLVTFGLSAAASFAEAGDEDPFSIVSMTLHDEALAGAHDVELSGDIAFVPGKWQSLSIIDIANPEKPEILWFKNDEEITDAETVLPFGDLLLLGTRDFLTLDITDPKSPRILKTLSDPLQIDRINGMILIGNKAIAANKSGFIDVFDISEIQDPTFVGALETAKQFNLQSPHDIARLGDHIVIVDPAKFAPPAGRIGVFKVADQGELLPLDQWKLMGKAEDEALIGANRVHVTGNHAVVAGSVTPRARTTAASLSPKMAVVDLSDPTQPAVVAHLPFPDVRGPNGLALAGKVAFCAGGQTVATYDLSDPARPKLLASQRFPIYRKAERTDNYHDLIYRDGLLYVSAQSDNGFLILKVNDERIRKLADSN